ncbi:MAG: hypothetical protein U0X39_16145 [Bacteroidales bacterium]
MKRIIRFFLIPNVIYILVMIIVSQSAYSQSKELVNPGQYLFPDFKRGNVAMRAGRDLNLVLNYNIVTEKIVFLQKGEVYDVMNQEAIDTAYISGHPFILNGNGFLEVVYRDGISLFIQHKGKIQPPARPAAYGGTSQVSSSTYINNMQFGNEVYRLKNEPDLLIKPEPVYWTLKDGQMRSFLNAKQLGGIYPDKKSQISKFVKNNKVKFDVTDDVVTLFTYLRGEK